MGSRQLEETSDGVFALCKGQDDIIEWLPSHGGVYSYAETRKAVSDGIRITA